MPGREDRNFRGFQPLTSNTTYTPNQVFDVALRHCSQSAFRLVAYLIRRTLGWVDSDGRPQESIPAVGFAEFVSRAGISRNRVRSALDEALSLHLIRLDSPGELAGPGTPGKAARYALEWDPRPDYVRDPAAFRGFFEGDGHRTDVPNDYFDVIVPNEPASVAKVVGTVLRFSIGFQARQGSRRQHAALSVSDLARYTRISSRRVLCAAIEVALRKRYLLRIEQGTFGPRRSDRRKAIYALCWADGWTPDLQSSGTASRPGGAKRSPAEPCEKVTSPREQRCEKVTRTGASRSPAQRCEKVTSIKTLPRNETTKPQVEAADHSSGLVQRLVDEGVSRANAERLARAFRAEAIERQLAWIDHRHVTRSRAGLLVRAIEGDWEKPESLSRPREASRFPASPEARREAHKDHHLPAYLDYLRAEEARIRERNPAEHAAFLSARAQERARIDRAENPWRAEHLARFDSDRARLKALMERFELMPFWDWDASENPDGLREVVQHEH